MTKRKRRYPKDIEGMNIHTLFLFLTISALVVELNRCSSPLLVKIFCTALFMALPIFLIKWDFESMIQRGLMAEGCFWQQEENE